MPGGGDVSWISEQFKVFFPDGKGDVIITRTLIHDLNGVIRDAFGLRHWANGAEK